MNLNSFDYYADKPDPAIGFTRTASLIREARQQAIADDALVLLFDNGDALQGTPLGEWAAEQTGSTHVLMQAFKALDYDAIGLGNHDFNFGMTALRRILQQAPCPVICSNASHLTSGTPWLSSAILRRPVLIGEQEETVSIGVLSVLPPQTAQWEAHRLHNKVVMTGILESAQDAVTDLRAKGSDLIVALAHSGLGSSQPDTGLENAVIPLAALDGIDAIVAGHSHLTLPGKDHDGLHAVDAKLGQVHGKPVVMPGAAGAFLGVIDLNVGRNSAGRWHIRDHVTELRPVSRHADQGTEEFAPENAGIRDLFAHGHDQVRARSSKPIGRTSHHLHSYFSFCTRDRGLALVSAAQAAALRMYLRNGPLADLAVLSATSPLKFGGRAGPRFYTDVPAGELCLRHISDLHIFPNDLRAVVVSGAQIRDWIEMSAGVFNQLSPATEGDLIDSRRAGHNFDVLFGLTCLIDLAQPPRFDANGRLTDASHHRISELRHNGVPVAADQRFVVALNNYRASGGGHFPVASQARSVELPILHLRDIIRDYVSGDLPRDPLEHAPCPFGFVPQPGATAILRTGPGATAHLAELDAYAPETLGQDSDGFLAIRLSF